MSTSVRIDGCADYLNKKGVRVVKWNEAGILSQQPGFDFRLGKNHKNY